MSVPIKEGTKSLPDIDPILRGEVKTLGWGVLEWCSENLVNPDQNSYANKGDPWVFMPDQAAFILWWYAVDEFGHWIYRRAYRERAKGSGKSPMVAAMGCAEFLGPVLFSHFDEDGNAVGKRHPSPRVQLAAVSKPQCMSTYTLMMEMLENCQDEYNLDIGLTRTIIKGRPTCIIEMVTNSSRSNEGFRPSFVIMEETHHWVPAEGGPTFAGTLRRNASKLDARSIEVTNAPVPGEGSVAEKTHEYWHEIQDGIAEDEDGLLFDTFWVKVEDIHNDEEVLAALALMYAEAPWVNIKRLRREIQDPAQREIDSRRFYFNELCVDAEMWITKDEWAAQANPRLKLKKTDLISLGFRGKKTCTAIVATRLTDGATFLLDMWEAPMGEARSYECPYEEVDRRMRRYMETYNVHNVFASPQGYQDIVGRWAIDFENQVVVEEFWSTTNKAKMSAAVEQFETAVYSERVIHDGNPDLARHIGNCFLLETTNGYILRQETPYSQRYIVSAEAAVIAFEAAQVAIQEGALKKVNHYVVSF